MSKRNEVAKLLADVNQKLEAVAETSPKEAMEEVMTTRSGGSTMEEKIDAFLKVIIKEGQKLHTATSKDQTKVEKMVGTEIPGRVAEKIILEYINKKSPWGKDAMSPLLAKLIAHGDFVF